ncbi:hypothetical protein Scep_018310 [Stephania cephalantha]|uniref:BHLH domain-containing protein n=1 Tax=Stephania cephalantha TaxID=152367 RepID=A0AAP0NUG9_9MAGN
MLSRVDGVAWMDGEGDEEEAISWARNNGGGGGGVDNRDDMVSLSTFKSMLEDDWYVNVNTNANPSHQDFQPIQTHHQQIKDPLNFNPNPIGADALLLQSVDSSSSCSPSSVFSLDPSQVHSFLPQKSCLSSLVNANPFENGFDLGCETGFLMGSHQNSNSPVLMNRGGGVLPNFNDFASQTQMGSHDLSSNSQFLNTHLMPLQDNNHNTSSSVNNFSQIGFGGFEGSGNSVLFNRAKVLSPLEIFPSVGAQPTLFQKRAALRQNSAMAGKIPSRLVDINKGMREMREEMERRAKNSEEDDLDDASIDVSGLNYDSDEALENNKLEESVKNDGNNSNANSTITGVDQKGKKKGLPAKNLMAERRRRKKLNDRLYMLRSVVPKITKMDRASILGDAIEYLKELLQRINDLHNELESATPGSSLPSNASFHPLTPTPPTLPCRVKEELCVSSIPSPNSQPARVEVRAREGRAVNIHMFCSRKPGLLLSTMKALDVIGLDIQQAVISCFNGFALDVFRAEQCKEGVDVPPEEIKAILLESAGFHGMA